MIKQSQWIQSPHNQLVKSWKKLHRRKERIKEKTMLIEGEHLLKEAVRSGMTILAWIVTEEKEPTLRSKTWFDPEQAQIYLLSPSVFASLTRMETPQGLMAVASIPTWSIEERLTGKTHLLLDEIQDPGNLGTIIRTAEATNVDAIWLGKGSVDPTNDKVIRAAMGSFFRVPIMICDLQVLIPQMQDQGVQVISTSPRAKENVFQLRYRERVAFLLGNEGRGITTKLADLVDAEVMLPMEGKTESLNVSITTAVLLYEKMRQQLFTCK